MAGDAPLSVVALTVRGIISRLPRQAAAIWGACWTVLYQEIWEWDGTNAKMLLESGVFRKPGAIVTYELTEGKIALTMTDGKVTGFTASGKGRFPTATGTAASLAGKSWTCRRRAMEGEATLDVTSQ